MARYTGPKNKKARRLGVDLGLKTSGVKLERRIGTPPGAHGRKGGNRKVSDYGVQLAEKQKAKNIYGILERQFKKYYVEASWTTVFIDSDLRLLAPQHVSWLAMATLWSTAKNSIFLPTKLS